MSHTCIEVLLVLDGMEENKAFFSQFKIPAMRIIELKENKGPAYARNTGASLATGKFFFFIDSDVVVSGHTIDRLLSSITQSNVADAIIGSYDDQQANQPLVAKYRNLLHHYTHQQASTKATTFWGACGVIKQEVFKKIGGFDESFTRPSIEDIALGYQLIKKGYFIHLDKSLQVTHLKRWSLKGMVYTDIFLRAKPWTLLLQQHQMWQETELNVSQEEKKAALLLVLGVACVVLSIWSVYALSVGITLLAALLALKRKLYTFYSQYFTMKEMPLVVLLHWLYILCAILGFVLGYLEYTRWKIHGMELENNEYNG